MTRCDSCYYCRYIPPVVRGSMDADPPEYYCARGKEDWFLIEEEDLKEWFTEEEIEKGCPEYDDTIDDYF